MTTARDLVSMAAREAGILGVGQTLLTQDINDCGTLLMRMLAQWQVRRWLVPGLTEVSAVGNNLKSNLIGPGQFYNAMRPDKILGAYFIQTNTGQQPVSFPLQAIWSYEDYIKVGLKTLNSFPQYFFYDGAFPNGNVYIWPIPTPVYEIHLLIKLPIGFSTAIGNGVITVPGAAYTDGHYEAQPFIGGTGTGATADFDVNGGVVTNVGIVSPGNGYEVNDLLSVSAASIGGTGAGFVWKVTGTTSSIDSTFNMPPEYEEAIHYNLALRICSMYDVEPKRSTGGLAKVSLNTIRNANAQVPTLVMPAQYRRNVGGFYIFNADAY